jgi:hypothetical protein
MACATASFLIFKCVRSFSRPENPFRSPKENPALREETRAGRWQNIKATIHGYERRLRMVQEPANNGCECIHVREHESHHQGQIAWFKSRGRAVKLRQRNSACCLAFRSVIFLFMDESENIRDNRPDNLAAGLSEESSGPNRPDQTNIKPFEEPMEVHHHPDLHHKRKKFKEYFLEFIMIFLAVTLGFIAENLRQTIEDREKGKEFAKSLYDDLKTDSAVLNYMIEFHQWKLNKIDSFILLMELPEFEDHAPALYYYQAHMDLQLTFNPTDITGQQLRNSGGFRYFKNPEIYKAISSYYNYVNLYRDREKERKVIFPNSLTAKLFRPDVLINLERITPDIRNSILQPPLYVKLIGADKQAINEYLLYAGNLKTATALYYFFLNGQIKLQLYHLMDILRKEYDLS